ncbi:MAG: Phosphoglycerate transport regulatory protein PgtC precursor [Lentisphaerae bacterium ADurb.Bin242]|nr:MAG: Phosphoglycerate transport regulatory protein PgtC precursor [Lentisphaerae bacterium ADurb.Bin242]
MKTRIFGAVSLLLLVLLLPFLFRRNDASLSEFFAGTDTVVIITAHSEPMKFELERGFREYYKKHYNRNVTIDWRSPGGTSDIVRYIADRFEAEFRHFWESDPSNPPWNPNIASAFANPSILSDKKANDEAKRARKKFLESDVGIGIDLFAGGGTYDQDRQARCGYAVDGGLRKRHPEFFRPDSIPQSFGGDQIYEKDGKYYGVCLASFGICYNADRLRELMKYSILPHSGNNAVEPPKRWRDLGKPEFFNTVVAADPTKSGSANKCYEIILQQEMHEAIPPGVRKPTPEQLDKGWANGLNLIKRIMANTRTITDSAGKVTRDVASGAAAVGMAIDFYGLTEQEWNACQTGGKPVIFYVPPEGGTAVSADPIQLLRGAPRLKTAHAFLDFMIGLEGQKLLNFKLNTPGGPVKYALRRSPVRMELYQEQYRHLRSDPDYNPYKEGLSFVYHPEWTGRYFSLIRVLIRCIALDVQDELRAAWREILRAGGPEKVPEAYRAFCRLPFEYRDAAEAAAGLRISRERTAVEVAALCRRWSDSARENYRKAAELAGQGK